MEAPACRQFDLANADRAAVSVETRQRILNCQVPSGYRCAYERAQVARAATASGNRWGLRRLPENLVPDDAGLRFAFKEDRQEHSRAI